MSKKNKITIKIGIFLFACLIVFSLVDLSSRPIEGTGTLSSCAGCASELDVISHKTHEDPKSSDLMIAIGLSVFVFSMVGVFQVKAWKLLLTIFLIWIVNAIPFSFLTEDTNPLLLVLAAIFSLTVSWGIILGYWKYGREKAVNTMFDFQVLAHDCSKWSDLEWYLWFKINAKHSKIDFALFIERVKNLVEAEAWEIS